MGEQEWRAHNCAGRRQGGQACENRRSGHRHQRNALRARRGRTHGYLPHDLLLVYGEPGTRPLSETPRTKPQAPEKFQISSPNLPKQMPGQTARRSIWSLELGASLEFGAWNLELFAWALSFARIEMPLPVSQIMPGVNTYLRIAVHRGTNLPSRSTRSKRPRLASMGRHPQDRF